MEENTDYLKKYIYTFSKHIWPESNSEKGDMLEGKSLFDMQVNKAIKARNSVWSGIYVSFPAQDPWLEITV